jgi:hypothetical protein
MQTEQSDLLIEATGRRKCGAHMELAESAIKIRATSPNRAGQGFWAFSGLNHE